MNQDFLTLLKDLGLDAVGRVRYCKKLLDRTQNGHPSFKVVNKELVEVQEYSPYTELMIVAHVKSEEEAYRKQHGITDDSPLEVQVRVVKPDANS